jgi:hypothetical protein
MQRSQTVPRALFRLTCQPPWNTRWAWFFESPSGLNQHRVGLPYPAIFPILNEYLTNQGSPEPAPPTCQPFALIASGKPLASVLTSCMSDFAATTALHPRHIDVGKGRANRWTIALVGPDSRQNLK